MDTKVLQIRPDNDWSYEWQQRLRSRTVLSGIACLEEMKQRHARGAQRLPRADRAKIAHALEGEVERLKRPGNPRRQFSTAAWMALAGVAADPANPTKRINEYVQSAFADTPERQERHWNKLHSGHAHFAALIEALFAFSDEDPESICARVFLGTSLAAAVPSASDRATIATLEDLVCRVNKVPRGIRAGATVEDLFARTALGRARLHQLGETCNWPFWDRDASDTHGDSNRTVSVGYWPPVASSHQVQDPRFGSFHPTDIEAASVMAMPRFYLGCAAYIAEFTDRGAEENHVASEVLEELRLGHGALAEVHPVGGKVNSLVFRDGVNGVYSTKRALEGSYLDGDGYCWLVMYPARNGKGLSPVLFWSRGECGVDLCPLREDNLFVLDLIMISGEPGAKVVGSLYERLADVLRNDGASVEMAWAQSSFDLYKNPVLMHDDLRASFEK